MVRRTSLTLPVQLLPEEPYKRSTMLLVMIAEKKNSKEEDIQYEGVEDAFASPPRAFQPFDRNGLDFVDGCSLTAKPIKYDQKLRIRL